MLQTADDNADKAQKTIAWRIRRRRRDATTLRTTLMLTIAILECTTTSLVSKVGENHLQDHLHSHIRRPTSLSRR